MTALAWVLVALLAALVLSVVTAFVLRRRAARLRDERHAAQWLEFVTRNRPWERWSR